VWVIKNRNKNKQKITYTFRNPNTDEVMIKHISEVLAETAVAKVQKAQEMQFRKSVNDKMKVV